MASDVPIPTFPSVPTYRLGLVVCALVETMKLPDTCNVAVGEDVPTPSNPPLVR